MQSIVFCFRCKESGQANAWFNAIHGNLLAVNEQCAREANMLLSNSEYDKQIKLMGWLHENVSIFWTWENFNFMK